MLRRSVAVALLAGSAGLLGIGGASTAMADTTGNHGPPNQTCQDFLKLGSQAPGHSSQSPGSPFDEAGFGASPTAARAATPTPLPARRPSTTSPASSSSSTRCADTGETAAPRVFRGAAVFRRYQGRGLAYRPRAFTSPVS